MQREVREREKRKYKVSYFRKVAQLVHRPDEIVSMVCGRSFLHPTPFEYPPSALPPPFSPFIRTPSDISLPFRFTSLYIMLFVPSARSCSSRRQRQQQQQQQQKRRWRARAAATTAALHRTMHGASKRSACSTLLLLHLRGRWIWLRSSTSPDHMGAPTYLHVGGTNSCRSLSNASRRTEHGSSSLCYSYFARLHEIEISSLGDFL